MNTIDIQVQDIGGNWLTVQSTHTGDDRYIMSLMKSIQSRYQGRRVRAMENGRLRDLLQ